MLSPLRRDWLAGMAFQLPGLLQTLSRSDCRVTRGAATDVARHGKTAGGRRDEIAQVGAWDDLGQRGVEDRFGILGQLRRACSRGGVLCERRASHGERSHQCQDGAPHISGCRRD